MESESDFFTGAVIGIGVGALGFYLLAKFSPSFDNSLLPTQSRVVIMDGTTPSISVNVGDTLTIRALNGTFTAVNTTGAIFDLPVNTGSSSQVVKVVNQGTETIQTTDSGGVSTTLTVTAS
jgi:hypothetical protein